MSWTVRTAPPAACTPVSKGEVWLRPVWHIHVTCERMRFICVVWIVVETSNSDALAVSSFAMCATLTESTQ